MVSKEKWVITFTCELIETNSYNTCSHCEFHEKKCSEELSKLCGDDGYVKCKEIHTEKLE